MKFVLFRKILTYLSGGKLMQLNGHWFRFALLWCQRMMTPPAPRWMDEAVLFGGEKKTKWTHAFVGFGSLPSASEKEETTSVRSNQEGEWRLLWEGNSKNKQSLLLLPLFCCSTSSIPSNQPDSALPNLASVTQCVRNSVVTRQVSTATKSLSRHHLAASHLIRFSWHQGIRAAEVNLILTCMENWKKIIRKRTRNVFQNYREVSFLRNLWPVLIGFSIRPKTPAHIWTQLGKPKFISTQQGSLKARTHKLVHLVERPIQFTEDFVRNSVGCTEGRLQVNDRKRFEGWPRELLTTFPPAWHPRNETAIEYKFPRRDDDDDPFFGINERK